MSNHIIGRTEIGKYLISTVKLPGAEESPEVFKGLIYETMVFEVDEVHGNTTSDVCVRYATYDEAVIGHENIVRDFFNKTIR